MAGGYPPTGVGAPDASPYAWPVLIQSQNNGGGSPDLTAYGSNLLPNSTLVVQGIDATAIHAEPVQCWVDFFALDVNSMMHDSQSTGEGLGVTFSWRGALPLGYNAEVKCVCHASAPILWAVTIWGYRVPGYYG